jgi:hypothetical protein
VRIFKVQRPIKGIFDNRIRIPLTWSMRLCVSSGYLWSENEDGSILIHRFITSLYDENIIGSLARRV